MNLNLYSIYDRKMNVYLSPFPARNNVDAVRNVQASIDNPQMRDTPVGKYPADFDLVNIGLFNDDTGEITGCPPVSLGSIASFAPVAPASTVSS